VLSKFPAGEIDEMRGPAGTIPVECAFCSKVLEIDL
jgi:redox-regulated HSP33 family molecular chaperone